MLFPQYIAGLNEIIHEKVGPDHISARVGWKGLRDMLDYIVEDKRAGSKSENNGIEPVATNFIVDS